MENAETYRGDLHPNEVAESLVLKVVIILSIEEKDPNPAHASAADPSKIFNMLSHHRLENPLRHRDQSLHVSFRKSWTSAPGVYSG